MAHSSCASRLIEPRAAVLYGVNDLRVEPWPVPTHPPPEGCVRVAIKAVGICGSDIHFLKHGRIADFVVTSPMVIGHESAGVVVEAGEGVKTLAVGDPVALEPGVPCWSCQAAREGRYNLDQGIKFFATPPVHGSLASFVDHPASLCYKLPDGMSLEEGAFCEPLSVGVHACR
jgi:L-iditol 2-dehydrogenase